ncbi:hypothetical protein CLAIMM_03243 [Cladophialophora immunda]|nr:hypothetical protein CLAIMM_03243 [Cladophialophora immunda]
MVAITFIQHDPTQEPRQKQLNSARARAHAARVSHDWRRSDSRQQSPSQSPEVDSKSEDSDDEYFLRVATLEGNSDPFRCFAIEITPELNRILTFTRDVALRAHYSPLAVRRMSSGMAGNFEQPYILGGWADIAASLRDEGTALARLTTYSQYLSHCVPNPKEMRMLVLQMRKRSLQLLREKLERHTDSSSVEEKNNLKRHIFSLFDAECFCGNTQAAIVHGVTLQKLINESNTFDAPMAQRLLYIICHSAATSGQRTVPSVGKWISERSEAFLKDQIPPHPLGVPRSRILHASVTLPELHDLFARCWYLGDASMQISPNESPTPAESVQNKRSAYIYVTVSALINLIRLNDMFHDLVEAVWMAGASRSERYTQAALSVALNYLTREMFGDLTIGGVNIRDCSAILMGQLRLTFTKAYQSSTVNDRLDFAPAYLWILYVGALCEHRRRDNILMVDLLDEFWFSPLLAFQAHLMGVMTWPHMRLVAEQFFYTDIVEPDGVIWFDALLKRHILENHNVSIWVSLALQIQLDIQRLSETKSLRAFRDLKEAYEVIKFRAEEYQKWHESLGVEIWDKSWHSQIRILVDQFGEWIKGKNCGKSDGKEVLQRVDAGFNMTDAVRASGRVPLLEYFPVTSGMMKTDLQLEWHTLGLKLVNKTAHVPMLCHLYNALRIVDPQSPVWPDMELLIRNQNPGKIFMGGRPGTLVQARNRFLLSIGASAASLGKDSRKIRFRKDNPGMREYEQSSIARNLFDRWMGQETRKIDEAAYRLQELLFGRRYREDLERNLYVTISSPAQTYPHKSLATLQTKMVRILGRLSEGFSAEMPALMFDFFSMERRCFAVFEQLVEDFQTSEEGGLRSTRLARNPALNPVEIAFDVFNDSVGSERMVHCLASKNRATNRAQGPAVAKHMKSMIPQFQDETSQAYLSQALTLIRNGRIGDVFGEYADLSEYATAARLFNPIRQRIESLVKQRKGDAELVELRRQVGTKDYGISLFRRSSLEALYGPGKEQSWKDIVVAENVIDEAMLRKADNPVLYLVALLFLHQKKIMCGTGEDSYERSGLRSNDVKDLERQIREKWFNGNTSKWEDMTQPDKEDWEKWEGIYGREGRLAPQLRIK